MELKDSELVSMSDEELVKRSFKSIFGYDLDLSNPRTYCEKMQWIKLYDRRDEYTTMVDKYRARDYISEKIGGEYLIPLIDVYDSPEEIDFDKLPGQFVLKCNHNSGLGMYICRDKSKLTPANIAQIKKNLAKGLKQDYFIREREWPYKNVERKIVCEKYMSDGKSESLNDFKVMCFEGEPRLIEVHSDRFTDKHTQDFCDTDWNRTSISQSDSPPSENPMDKPDTLNEMLELSRKLCAGIHFLRVDWYSINGKLYFGELTFFDGSGLEPFDDIKDDEMMGSWIKLPTDN